MPAFGSRVLFFRSRAEKTKILKRVQDDMKGLGGMIACTAQLVLVLPAFGSRILLNITRHPELVSGSYFFVFSFTRSPRKITPLAHAIFVHPTLHPHPISAKITSSKSNLRTSSVETIGAALLEHSLLLGQTKGAIKPGIYYSIACHVACRQADEGRFLRGIPLRRDAHSIGRPPMSPYGMLSGLSYEA